MSISFSAKPDIKESEKIKCTVKEVREGKLQQQLIELLKDVPDNYRFGMKFITTGLIVTNKSNTDL